MREPYATLAILERTTLDKLLAAYLAALVEDAAHALVRKYSQHYPQAYCQPALEVLQTGLAGSDQLVDTSPQLIGVEPDFVYKMLLGQARMQAVRLGKGIHKPKKKVA